ncbi:MAG: tetratricopeptide repeat protein [Deltaproteobacteria bacterium]|nr:tetratricopeptide repeat protein [Deltaproteobacteria bacterium]
MACQHNRFWIVGILVIAFLSGCVPNETLRKQGESSRNLGEAYMAQQNYTAALKELLAAEQLTPDDPYLHNDLGLTYMAKDRLDLAIQHFKKALVLKPDYAPAMNNLGTVYLAQQNWDAAIVCFKAITGDLLYATPHFPLSNLGFAYYNQKKYDLSAKYYQEALKIEPGFPMAIRGLGRTYQAQGKRVEAIALLEEGVKLFPKSPELYNELGAAYLASKNYSAATAAYTKVIELSQPSSPLAKEAQKSLDSLRTKDSSISPK